jgi:hypothetical protein
MGFGRNVFINFTEYSQLGERKKKQNAQLILRLIYY